MIKIKDAFIISSPKCGGINPDNRNKSEENLKVKNQNSNASQKNQNPFF